MTPIPEANQNPRESGDTAPRALRLVHWIPASAGEQGFLTAVLVKLAAKAPNHVWLGAAPLYRGADARRLARLARTAPQAGVPLLAKVGRASWWEHGFQSV